MRKFSLVFADDHSENEERKNRGTFVDNKNIQKRIFNHKKNDDEERRRRRIN